MVGSRYYFWKSCLNVLVLGVKKCFFRYYLNRVTEDIIILICKNLMVLLVL